MARRPLKLYGDPVLRENAAAVEELGTDELRELVADMFETCTAEEGAGLAAPQVGVSLRLFVVDCPEDPEDSESPQRTFAILNPEIVARSGAVNVEEGCLSIPGIRGTVRRAAEVTLRGYDVDGQPLEIEGRGLVARCIQHEMDHVNGVLFIDRLSSLKRQLIKRDLEEIAEQAS